MSTPPTDGEGPRRRWLGVATVAAAYFLLACLLYWPVGPLDSRHIVNCSCADPVQEVWFLRWLPFAITHGHNPFFTSYLNMPYGANLSINTSMPLLGLIGWPVTAALGPVATYNLLLRLALALSGTAMYVLMRRYVSWRPAAFGAGLLFAFSPFMAGHAQRHLFLTFLPLVPLLVLLVDDWLVSCRRSPVVAGALIGLAAALEFLISPEVVALFTIGVVVGLAVLARTHVQQARERVTRAVRGLAAAAVTFVALAGYPAYELVAGPLRPSGPIHPFGLHSVYHADLLSPVLPTPNILLAPHALLAPDNLAVIGHGQEPGMYVGLPMLAALLYVVVRFRRLLIVRVLTATMVVAFILALGPRLTIDGRVAVPAFVYILFRPIPVLQNMEPDRFALIAQFAVAALVGVGADRLYRGWRVRPRLAGRVRGVQVGIAAVVAVILLLPVVPSRISSALVTAPPFFTTSRQRVIPSGALALTYPFSPFSRLNSGMLWQSVDGMRFRIFGGEVFVPGADGHSTPVPTRPIPHILLPLMRGNDQSTGSAHWHIEQQALLRLLRGSKVDVVLAWVPFRGSQRFIQLVQSDLGSKPDVADDVAVWLHVRGELTHAAATP
ncbi:MAG TPA: hypothetical protein VFJ17_14720 [Mycobacteriales bacterium]|jgi:hypothetical protein|nr:hypothetical protein [Mycobacteriales bacterium]